jgi:hypothetical protein
MRKGSVSVLAGSAGAPSRGLDRLAWPVNPQPTLVATTVGKERKYEQFTPHHR